MTLGNEVKTYIQVYENTETTGLTLLRLKIQP